MPMRTEAEIAQLAMGDDPGHAQISIAARSAVEYSRQVLHRTGSWTADDVIVFNRVQMALHGLDVLPDAPAQQPGAPVNQGLKQAVDDGRKANNPGSSADSPGTTGGADQGQKKP